MRRLLQRTLDMFDLAPAPVPVPARSPIIREKKKFQQKSPNPSIQRSFDATDLVEMSARKTTPALLAPAHFAHPRASRVVTLGGAHVAYAFSRSRRRSIGFSIGPDGLSVRAPNWVPLREVDAALQEKSVWILRKLGEARERRAGHEAARIDWRDGAALPYRGEPLRLLIDPSHSFAAVGAQLAPAPEGTDDPDGTTAQTLRVALAHTADAAQIRDAVQAWLMRQAKALFVQRLDHFAPQLGVQWRRLSLSSAGTRWGSASADGSIRLNWRLVHLRLALIDYVVVHELSHLRVMDHSPRFWATVQSVLPDYAALRGDLRRLPVAHG